MSRDGSFFNSQSCTFSAQRKPASNQIQEGIDKKVEVKKRQEMLAIVVSCPKFPEGKTQA